MTKMSPWFRKMEKIHLKEGKIALYLRRTSKRKRVFWPKTKMPLQKMMILILRAGAGTL